MMTKVLTTKVVRETPNWACLEGDFSRNLLAHAMWTVHTRTLSLVLADGALRPPDWIFECN